MNRRIAAIMLAAGESRRMGEANKLLLPVEGRALVRRTAEVLLASGLHELIVVLGHDAERVRRVLSGLPLRFVWNPDYAGGQMSSVVAGLQALGEDFEGAMVALADQPLIESADIDCLVRAFLRRKKGKVLIPTYQGRRGNPIVLDYAYRAEILAGGRNLGCRHFIENNPQLVRTMEMDNDHVVVDLDTPEEYLRLTGRIAGQREPVGVMV